MFSRDGPQVKANCILMNIANNNFHVIRTVFLCITEVFNEDTLSDSILHNKTTQLSTIYGSWFFQCPFKVLFRAKERYIMTPPHIT